MNSKDIVMFKEVLTTFKKRSTCARLQVAALLVREGRIVSTGWNGVPAGKKHCNEIFKTEDIYHNEEIKHEHHKFAEINELHAEVNVLGYSARYGIQTKGCDMIISLSPCVNCAKLIIASGIREVYFTDLYDRNIDGLQVLVDSGVKWYHI